MSGQGAPFRGGAADDDAEMPNASADEEVYVECVVRLAAGIDVRPISKETFTSF